MNDVYKQASSLIARFSSLYASLPESDRCVYDDLVVLENCDLQTSGFATEEEKTEHMVCCIKHLQNKTDVGGMTNANLFHDPERNP